MKEDWDLRRTALEAGATYRVAVPARSIPEGPDFVVGEDVRLRQVGYSHYDSSHVYIFEAPDGRQKQYWLHDDEPLETLHEAFQR